MAADPAGAGPRILRVLWRCAWTALVACGCQGRPAAEAPKPQAAAPRAEGRVPEILEARVVKIKTGDGERFCWFEVKGDPLIVKFALGKTRPEEYEISRMGEKKPEAPDAEFRIGADPPDKSVACWRISAARQTGDHLWLALEPIRRPTVMMWIGRPPHPHGSESGGHPYEGGIVRLHIPSGAAHRWTSARDLPDALVCRDAGRPLADDVLFGAVVKEIGEDGGELVFLTRNGSEVRLDPAKSVWRTVRRGEPAALVSLLRAETAGNDHKGYAIGRLGMLRAREAVPALIEVLASKPTAAGNEHRYEAMEALVAIADARAVAPIQELLRDKGPYIRRAAASALGGFGPQARPAEAALKKLLEDEDAEVRTAAAEALKKIRGEGTR
jgi:hypothetical protein